MSKVHCEIQYEILLSLAYELYIKNWCKERGYDVKKVRKALANDEEYNGEMIVCLRKFEDSEFPDKEYMEYLLDRENFEIYKEVMGKR